VCRAYSYSNVKHLNHCVNYCNTLFILCGAWHNFMYKHLILNIDLTNKFKYLWANTYECPH